MLCVLLHVFGMAIYCVYCHSKFVIHLIHVRASPRKRMVTSVAQLVSVSPRKWMVVGSSPTQRSYF